MLRYPSNKTSAMVSCMQGVEVEKQTQVWKISEIELSKAFENETPTCLWQSYRIWYLPCWVQSSLTYPHSSFFFKKKSLFFSHAIQIDIGNFKVFSTIEEKALALLWMPIKVPQGYLSLQFMGGIGTQLLIQTDYSSPPSTPSSALPTPLSPRSTPPPYPFITEQIS